MLRFAANLSFLFTELDFLDRFGAAAAAGFKAVEFPFPYDHDPARLAGLLEEHELTLVLHNLPPGDRAAGDRGLACLPNRRDEFRSGLEAAVRYARTLGCSRLNCAAGVLPANLDEGAAKATLIDNLRYAADRLARDGIELLVEPISAREIPGFFLSRTDQAMEVIDAVGSPNLRLQLDVYHTQVMQGDLARTIEALLPRIGHIQVADNPGRHEPGTGEINYGFLFALIDRLSYDGWIGCEYRPMGETRHGLAWLAPYHDEMRVERRSG